MSETLKVPKNTVASVILKWDKFGMTKTLPRADRRSKLSNPGRRALFREVTLTELQSSSVEMGELSRRTIISASLHQPVLYGRAARRKPLLSKRHMPARLEFVKRNLKDSRTTKTRFSCLMKPRLNSLIWMPSVTSGGNLAPPYGEARWWQRHDVGMFFLLYTCMWQIKIDLIYKK